MKPFEKGIRLVKVQSGGGGVDNAQGRQFDVARDGRFLILQSAEEATVFPITLLMNWKPPTK